MLFKNSCQKLTSLPVDPAMTPSCRVRTYTSQALQGNKNYTVKFENVNEGQNPLKQLREAE